MLLPAVTACGKNSSKENNDTTTEPVETTEAESTETTEAETTDTEQAKPADSAPEEGMGGATTGNGWAGVYRYDDGGEGLLFVVRAADDTTVSGELIFDYSSGGYGSRKFEWSILADDTDAASEPFQGDQSVIYHKQENSIVAKYPKGWWPLGSTLTSAAWTKRRNTWSACLH